MPWPHHDPLRKLLVFRILPGSHTFMSPRATSDPSVIPLLPVEAEYAKALKSRQLLVEVGGHGVWNQRLQVLAALVADASKLS